MKRSLRTAAALSAVAALALTVAGCAPAEEAAKKDITIAFVMGAESDPF